MMINVKSAAHKEPPAVGGRYRYSQRSPSGAIFSLGAVLVVLLGGVRRLAGGIVGALVGGVVRQSVPHGLEEALILVGL